MQPDFDFVHLDPSFDPPESYQDAFELFGELWTELRAFQASCAHDQVILTVTQHLEHQLAVAGLVLAIQLDILNHP
ncbi:hypothetical protein [Bradyrhizobium sp. UNPA324]|uniref:hypothetical protein n=1 Tax=Bradyrhizobium sp. UNPA324 TaxID=1141174 RepID=UPI00114F3D03|nr:hypothetical protein [Bradyrhizobium sp. UNPA324]TQF34715.1 hypothetical protein UNPA324_30950 [Bradyrhizobium sp. UNPA324]